MTKKVFPSQVVPPEQKVVWKDVPEPVTVAEPLVAVKVPGRAIFQTSIWLASD